MVHQVSPYVQLDLARYACMNVSVSFAVSSTGGLTNFSQTTQVTVRGGIHFCLVIYFALCL